MKKPGIFGGFLLIFLAMPAYAGVPEDVLAHDYAACIGDDPSDANRAAYCACVRDGMRNWDEAAYAEVSNQAAEAATGKSAQLPDKLQDLARQCIAQVLH